MNLAVSLSILLLLQILLGLGFLSSFAVTRFFRGAREQLKWNSRFLTLVLILSVLAPLLRPTPVFEPTVRIWSDASAVKNQNRLPRNENKAAIEINSAGSFDSIDTHTTSLVFAILIFGLLGLVVWRVGREFNLISRLKRESYLLKRLGRVSIWAHPLAPVPFSYWLPNQANIVVSTELAVKEKDLKMAIAHEIQHHRQGDTQMVYPLLFLKTVCFFNPFAHLWVRKILELQEFACDEALVDQNKVGSNSYARCLVETAQTALHAASIPVCAAGFVGGRESQLLRRRIVKILSNKTETVTANARLIQKLVLVGVATLLTTAALAAGQLVQDRRVTMSEAKAWAAKTKTNSEFPVVVNELVVEQLNRFLGTPEGRSRVRAALERMKTYQPMIEAKIAEYDAPIELLAVPIVESGYQNFSNAGHGAGLWQFIASTARRYGLRVDETIDERLDVEKETDAAMRYLTANNNRFKNWSLALIAYNMGENNLQKGIDREGTSDPWELTRRGVEGDDGYLAKVMAAVLILKNPEAVR